MEELTQQQQHHVRNKQGDIRDFPRRRAWRFVLIASTAIAGFFAVISASHSLRDDNGTVDQQQQQQQQQHQFLRDSNFHRRFLDGEETTSPTVVEGYGQCELDCCWQYESTICPNENGWIDAIPFAIQILLIIILISLSALFSGLTLGLMSLDKTGLEIVMSGDDPKQAEYARIIYPIREDGNLLLCTLLLGNVAVNALLSILLAEYAGGLIGLISSTMLIVIFGEIVPQALCSRYALYIGSRTIPLVRVIRCILYPIAGPLGKCLDCALGSELATTYSGAEMMKLLQIHVQENVIDKETAGAMAGALTYKNILVKEVMTPTDQAFMLNVDDKLSFETIAKIFKTGFSRVPIYEIHKNNIIGMLIVKDLIFVDPEDDIPIRSFVQIFGRAVHVVWPDDTLGDVLSDLKKGRSHLAIVRDVNNEDETQDPFYEVKGIITLEDIIEKILGDSITDETDAVTQEDTEHIKFERGEFEWARLRLLDAKIVDEMLSPSEVQAVTAHFRVNYANAVQLLTDTQLNRLVASTPVSSLPTAVQEIGQELPSDLLYKKGTPSDVCTLILGGRVTILVGEENFRSELSSWSVLGRTALESNSFSPDFSAYVSDGPCRCLRIKHSDIAEAVDASTIERRMTENKSAGFVLSKTSEAESAGGENTAASVASGESMSGRRESMSGRREKLFAKLFTKKNNASPEKASVPSPPVSGNGASGLETAPEQKRSSVVRFEEADKADLVPSRDTCSSQSTQSTPAEETPGASDESKSELKT